MDGINKLLVTIGRSVGGVVGTLYQAGRDSVDTTIRNVIPFMAFISFIIGLILATGVGTVIAEGISGTANNIVGLLIVSIESSRVDAEMPRSLRSIPDAFSISSRVKSPR